MKSKSLATQSVLYFCPDLDWLKRFADTLNASEVWLPSNTAGKSSWVRGDRQPFQNELRRLVEAWFRSGPNTTKLFSKEPRLAKRAGGLTAELIAVGGPTVRLHLSTSRGNSIQDPVVAATSLFLNFLLSPYNEKLAVPCRQCDSYFVTKHGRQKVYCCRRCALKFTSVAAIQKRRDTTKAVRLKLVEDTASEWAKARTSLSCRDWVSRKTNISKNWLTRRAKRGEFVEPARQRR